MKSKSQPKPLEILVVEDSPTQAEQLRHHLEQHNFRVIVAGNGADALEQIRMHPPTLVISDVNMPAMDGFEFCRRLRADNNTASVPVILLTALSDTDDVFKGLECGADNFLTKPYEVDYLLARIHYLLANIHLRNREKVEVSMEVFLAGRKHVIMSDRAQILNLLLSTYEAAVQRNRELTRVQLELSLLNSQLETKVRERTATLANEVTERWRAEGKVQKLNEQLELRVRERTEQLDAFSYSVSHDLRAPLRAMHGFSTILLNKFEEHLPPEARRLLGNVVDASKRMGQLIDDLLKFAQLGRLPVSKTRVGTNALVGQVLDELRRENPNRQIEIRVGDLPDCVADIALLKQVLVNLLSNAFKFTGNKSDATVEIGCLHQYGEQVYFIRDNGAGFDMKYAGKLFGVFHRLHRDDEFEGTGVGLSIVQRVIQRHGGRIWAEAQINQGATFYFTVPE